MKRFAALYDDLDRTGSTLAKVELLVEYFEEAPAADAAWALYFFMGRRSRRPVTTTQMRELTYEMARIPEWLFEDSYARVGDLGETIALILDGQLRGDGEGPGLEVSLSEWVARLETLRAMESEEQAVTLRQWWLSLDLRGVFLLNKLLMGALRVGVSSGLVTRALAEWSGLEKATIAHRLMGHWDATGEFFESLVAADDGEARRSRPYPYFLANPLEEGPEELGEPEDWLVEWKWDGIRGQLIRRGGECFLWSRGQELIVDAFPEVVEAGEALPDGTVLDGEVMAWSDGPLPFSELQRRIGRKKVGKKLRADVPAYFVAYDLLEWGGEDLRGLALEERRGRLEELFGEGLAERLRISEVVEAESWEAYRALRETSRERQVEGMMLKRLASGYGTGRTKGDWWKWKVEPYTIDAVLLYAKAGRGRRAGLHTDYTFGVWTDDESLVPIAKAYSGLSDKEIRELDGWIKQNTLERFGPVRSVKALHVFELAFAGLGRSSRHKSGIALRFPRIQRWRRDKGAGDANTLGDVEELLALHYGD